MKTNVVRIRNGIRATLLNRFVTIKLKIVKTGTLDRGPFFERKIPLHAVRYFQITLVVFSDSFSLNKLFRNEF